jgi:hypothetical protein
LSELEYLKSRGVTELIHFTPMSNIKNILSKGIIPRNQLEKDGEMFTFSDEVRLDGKEHINLSITNPNIKMFFKFRKKNEDPFVVITLNPSLLSKYKHSFSATNAASNKSMSCSIEELFSGNRPQGYQNNWTTDNQAEILVGEVISPNYIQSIHFPVEGKYPSENVRLFYDEVKEIIISNKLRISLIISHSKFAWNHIAAGSGVSHVYSAFYESWKADFSEYEKILDVINEIKTTTRFDTCAVSHNELSAQNKELHSFNRRNTAKWKLEYFRPQEQQIRSDNELSAIAVVEKIILRGRITLLSRELENNIEESYINKAHQIQAAIIELLKHQKLKARMKIFLEVNMPDDVIDYVLNDIKNLFENICSLYPCDDSLESLILVKNIDEADLIISNTKIIKGYEKKTALISNLNNQVEIIDFDFTKVQSPVEVKVNEQNIKYLLNFIFGYEEFRENQIDGIIRGLNRNDSIVLLPTGSGKSIVFQLLSLITPGIAIVVSPIISLIEDQIINLYNKGIDRVTGLSSAMDKSDKENALQGITNGQFLISYVSPERFQNIEFRASIKYYAKTNKISAIAIDEAHCVSEWGHDFRTAYLGLAETCRSICKTGNYVPPLLALTGTASASVLRDMQHDLGIIGDEAIIRPKSFDRPEIIYRVYNIHSKEKQRVLQNIVLNKLPEDFKTDFDSFYKVNQGENTNCGLVFCQNVNGQFGILASERQAAYGFLGVGEIMNYLLPKRVGFYSGGAPNRLDLSDAEWSEQKRQYAAKIKNNEHIAMVCTKAFGMGIDKPNFRWIVHYGISSSLESYYQEAGRAARDKKTAFAYLILSDDFPELNSRILNPTLTNIKEISKYEESKGKWEGDDISRTLFFHTSTFEGVDDEIRRVRQIWELYSKEYFGREYFSVPFGREKNEIEKAIYRLQLLGFFKGYSVDYQDFGGGRFIIELNVFERNQIIENYIEYIRAYQDNDDYAEVARKTLTDALQDVEADGDFVVKVIETLLKEFTYKVIEEGRRRATLNMLEAAKAASICKTDQEANDEFRKRLLAYLSNDISNAGKKSARLKDVINNATDVAILLKIVKSANTRHKKENLIGETDRLLEAYPQHYGFHYIKSCLYLALEDYDRMIDSLQISKRFGAQDYGLSFKRIEEDIIKLLNAKESEHVKADSWNYLVMKISELLSVSEDYLYEMLDHTQAKVSMQVNIMSGIASIVNNRQVKEN